MHLPLFNSLLHKKLQDIPDNVSNELVEKAISIAEDYDVQVSDLYEPLRCWRRIPARPTAEDHDVQLSDLHEPLICWRCVPARPTVEGCWKVRAKEGAT